MVCSRPCNPIWLNLESSQPPTGKPSTQRNWSPPSQVKSTTSLISKQTLAKARFVAAFSLLSNQPALIGLGSGSDGPRPAVGTWRARSTTWAMGVVCRGKVASSGNPRAAHDLSPRFCPSVHPRTHNHPSTHHHFPKPPPAWCGRNYSRACVCVCVSILDAVGLESSRRTIHVS